MPEAVVDEPAKAKKVELPTEDELDEQGLVRVDAAPFIFITDWRVDQLDTVIEVIPTLIAAWDQTFQPLAKTPTWTVFLIEKVEPFKKLNLLPRGGIPFNHGLQLDDRLWLRVQETEYYTRHLFIHEATHARMMAVSNFQGDGTLWFHEGVAEYIATHVADAAGKVQLAAWPMNPRQLLGWNHFQKLQEANKENRTSTLPWVLGYEEESYRKRDGQPYADSWALCQFLSRHPQYRIAFERCLKALDWSIVSTELTEKVMKDYSVKLEWLAWLAAISPDDNVVQPVVSLPLMKTRMLGYFPVQSWVDSSGYQLPDRITKVKVDGRLAIQVKGREVMSGPDGITIEYRHGFPLGALLGVYARHDLDGQVTNPFSHPHVFNGRMSLDIPEGEYLYLSINHFPQTLKEGQEGYRVQIPAPAEFTPATVD